MKLLVFVKNYANEYEVFPFSIHIPRTNAIIIFVKQQRNALSHPTLRTRRSCIRIQTRRRKSSIIKDTLFNIYKQPIKSLRENEKIRYIQRAALFSSPVEVRPQSRGSSGGGTQGAYIYIYIPSRKSRGCPEKIQSKRETDVYLIPTAKGAAVWTSRSGDSFTVWLEASQRRKKKFVCKSAGTDIRAIDEVYLYIHSGRHGSLKDE